jgi:hypothetical protein
MKRLQFYQRLKSIVKLFPAVLKQVFPIFETNTFRTNFFLCFFDYFSLVGQSSGLWSASGGA